jgi:hypothetical protein
MQRRPVKSSDLKSIGYDDASQILEIEFHSGGIYQYSKVPPSVFNELVQAASKGKYFHKCIKKSYGAKRIR